MVHWWANCRFSHPLRPPPYEAQKTMLRKHRKLASVVVTAGIAMMRSQWRLTPMERNQITQSPSKM